MVVTVLTNGGIFKLKVFCLETSRDEVELIRFGPKVADEVHGSFHKAQWAAYSLLTSKRISIRSPRLGYEFKDATRDRLGRLIGESAGLAFGVAALYSMQDLESDLLIGATGVILDVENGTVGPVQALDQKLRHALQDFEDGGTIFYPIANEADVTDDVRDAAGAKELKLLPASSLDEVFQKLFDTVSRGDVAPSLPLHPTITLPPVEKPAAVGKVKPRRIYGVALSTLALLFLSYGYFAPAIGAYLLESGYFPAASWHLQCAKWLAFYRPAVKELRTALESPFQATLYLTVVDQQGKEKQYGLDQLPGRLILDPNDGFFSRVIPTEPGYLYVFLTDRTGAFWWYYPSRASDELVRSAVTVPEKGISEKLPASGGDYELCFLMTRWRCRGLDKARKESGVFESVPEIIRRYETQATGVWFKRVKLSSLAGIPRGGGVRPATDPTDDSKPQ